MANSERLPEAALAAVAAQVGDRIAGIAGDLLTQLSETNTLEVNASDISVESKTLAKPNIQMGEYFAVWMLGADDVLRGARERADLLDLAKNTGHVHHQIKFDGKALAYARSLLLDDKPKDRSLCELSVSALAEEIQKAMDWSDAEVPDEYLTRLLIVPAYHVRAFWFIPEKENEEKVQENLVTAEKDPESFVYVLSAPARFRMLKRRLGSQEFLTALRDQSSIIGYR